ncbi:MAG: radical SAM protein [Nanoarchaeota archaeon]|nr:radical SAM protein [Nanoarchaeota archaeon]
MSKYYKYDIKPKLPIQVIKGGTKLMTCGMSFKVDLYSGCEHDCCYCYAKHLVTIYSKWKKDPMKLNLKLLEQMFVDAFENNRKGQIYDLMRNRFALRAGSLTDNFQEADLKYKVGLKLLELLDKYDYPCIINTKGIIITKPDYLKLLKRLAKKQLVIVQYSLISLNEGLLKELEPGAPPPKERLKALKTLADNGIPTQIRIAPFIPWVTINCEDLIKEAKKVECKAIIVEFLRIPPKKPNEEKSTNEIIYNATKKVYGKNINLWKRYQKEGGKLHRGYMKFPFEKRLKIYLKLKELIEKEGMDFYVCNELKPDLNEKPFDCACCCGVENYKGFKNFNTASSNKIYKMLKEKGKISLNDVKKNLKSLDWNLFEKQWDKGVYEDLLYKCKKEYHQGKIIYSNL